MIIGNLFPFFNGISWSMTKEVNLMKDGTVGVVQLAHWAIMSSSSGCSPCLHLRRVVLQFSAALLHSDIACELSCGLAAATINNGP